MTTHLDVFYDYTCGDAFRFKKLLDLLPEGAVEVDWRAYSLREHQRTSDEQSIFERGLESFALLALALAQALAGEGFRKFHDEVYDAINLEHRKMEREDLFHIAEAAGLDRVGFEKDEDRWLDLIKAQHEEGKTQWNSLGTPTVVFGGNQAVYIEVSDIPSSRERAEDVWREIETIAAATPEVREIKRSV